jgi:hypothetical protein
MKNWTKMFQWGGTLSGVAVAGALLFVLMGSMATEAVACEECKRDKSGDDYCFSGGGGYGYCVPLTVGACVNMGYCYSLIVSGDGVAIAYAPEGQDASENTSEYFRVENPDGGSVTTHGCDGAIVAFEASEEMIGSVRGETHTIRI